MITRGMNVRRRRDASRESIHMLEQRIMLLEVKGELTESDRQSALRMSKMINDVTSDFKTYHFSIVDQIEEEEEAKAEQDILTQHELKVMDLIDRIGKIIEVPGVPVEMKDNRESNILRKRIDQAEKGYRIIKAEFDEHAHEMDIYALHEQEESIEDSKLELRKISRDLLSVEDAGDLEDRAITLERFLRALKTDVKRLRGSKEEKPLPPTASGTMGMSGIQLPKIEVPTFDGNLLNWRFFWERFESTIHNKTQQGSMQAQ